MRAVLLMALVAQPAPAGGPTQGTLDRESIRQALHSRLGEVQRCGEAALLRRPGGLPKVTVRFVIGAQGRVTSAEVEGRPPEDATYGQCLLDVVKRVKTPPPRGGPVVVSYPFLICGVGF
ncbi:MAG: energy transducer TonB [Myxococcaceae bacterium]|nr:energy transducer TonB [Myxococcaceae bacterium]